ncbi:polyhydroxybutyrate depolymerase [Octadecabacter sp.]|nr:polyhydroxybutyrate depolymerase [Octadecabacter sp.]
MIKTHRARTLILAVLGSLTTTPVAAQACGDAQTACTVESGTYHIALPDVDPRGAVVLLHGGGGRGQGLLNTNLARQALERGFIFVAPNGEHPGARFPNNWAVRADNFEHDKDDIAFLGDVLDDVAETYDVDRSRMLLAGFSRGGSMVWDVACFAPDLARAYAPSAGAFWDTLPDTCAGPVDLFHTHGWNDRTVPLEGRPLWDGAIAQGDVWDSLKILRETNGCTARQPTRSSVIGDRWFKHWEDCTSGRIDLMLHPGGHGSPSDWAPRVLDWFDARLDEPVPD